MTPKFKLTVFSESWMVFYGTEICFKGLLKVSIFAEIFNPRQKFLLNCLSWSKCIWSQNLDFHAVPLRLVEISERQNWANVGNLAYFAQNVTKKQQMLKNDVFWHFWRWVIFEKNLTHNSKISNMALMTVEISVNPKILGIINLGPKKSSNMCAPFFFITILRYIEFFVNFHQKFLTIFDPTWDPFDPIGAFLGVGRNFWHKKKFFPRLY